MLNIFGTNVYLFVLSKYLLDFFCFVSGTVWGTEGRTRKDKVSPFMGHPFCVNGMGAYKINSCVRFMWLL